jgi:hypothetical protein
MKLTNRIVIAVLLVTLAGTAAFGKTRKKYVTFDDAVTVNGTVVRPGNYEVTYDEMTMELAVLKNKKVVVKTAAHTEARDRKASDTQVTRRMVGNASELVSITFGGTKDDVVVGQGGMQAGGTN